MSSEEKILELVNDLERKDLTNLKILVVYISFVCFSIPFILDLEPIWTSNIVWLTATLSLIAQTAIILYERK